MGNEQHLNAAAGSLAHTVTHAASSVCPAKLKCGCRRVNATTQRTTRHGGDVSGAGPRSGSPPEDVTAAPEPLGPHEADRLGVNTKGTAAEERRWRGEQQQQQRRRRQGERVSPRPGLQLSEITINFEKEGFCKEKSSSMSDPSHWSAVPSQNKSHFVPGALLKRSKRYFIKSFGVEVKNSSWFDALFHFN